MGQLCHSSKEKDGTIKVGNDILLRRQDTVMDWLRNITYHDRCSDLLFKITNKHSNAIIPITLSCKKRLAKCSRDDGNICFQKCCPGEKVLEALDSTKWRCAKPAEQTVMSSLLYTDFPSFDNSQCNVLYQDVSTG